jgi:hypothetical protein
MVLSVYCRRSSSDGPAFRRADLGFESCPLRVVSPECYTFSTLRLADVRTGGVAFNTDAVLARTDERTSDARQRYVLSELVDTDAETVSLESVTDGVVERDTSHDEGTKPPDRREVMLSLAHYHLPKLDDVGVIEYDRDDRVLSNYDLAPGIEAIVEHADRIERA